MSTDSQVSDWSSLVLSLSVAPQQFNKSQQLKVLYMIFTAAILLSSKPPDSIDKNWDFTLIQTRQEQNNSA